MKKLLVAVFCLFAVGLLILGSQTNVVGYQTVQRTKDFVVQVEVSGSSSKKAVKLSEDQYQQLNIYMKDFQARLNASHSLDETKALFKEALIQLKTLGLLTGVNMDVLYTRMCKFLPRHVPQKPPVYGSHYVSNRLCFVFVNASLVNFQRPIICFSVPLNFLFGFIARILPSIPFGVGTVVGLGLDRGIPGSYYRLPSCGYVYTSGIDGLYPNSGSFFGALDFCEFIVGIPISSRNCAFPAMFGYTGIKITKSNGETFLLGASLIAQYTD